MRQSEIIQYYSNRAVMDEITRACESREVAVRFQGGGFGKRPEIISFPKEVEQLARQGGTSFHISQERWHDPLKLSSESTKADMDNLRSGWDFVIDIDCPWFEYSTLAAQVVIEALKFHGIKPSIKFSGNRGWHIAIPFEAFPTKLGKRDTTKLFPEASTAVIAYMREFIEERLREKLVEKEKDIKVILEKTGKKKEEVFKEGKLDVVNLIELDLALGAPRHLIRSPYSLHEKSGLVSLPINIEDLEKFDREWAKPENIKDINDSFFNAKYITAGAASQLLIQALDFREIQREPKSEVKEYIQIEGKIPKERFPPSIKFILNGVEDGKKRGLFILLNFLKCVNWDLQSIEEELTEWNKRNAQPLKIGYVRSQLNWHIRNPKKVPPPNYSNDLYWKDTGFYHPDNRERKLKNALGYFRGRKV